MKRRKVFICALIGFLGGSFLSVNAQSGDQILDGIGETGLIARYVFEGDVKDWSRNNLHADLKGSGGTFVKDEQFGTVLSLAGNGSNFITIPGAAVTGEESVSVSGWVYLKSAEAGQPLLDFGKNKGSHVVVYPLGINNEKGLLTKVQTESGKNYETKSSVIAPYSWNHVVVVIDVPSKSLKTYVNGKLAAETKNVDLELDELLAANGNDNTVLLGKSLQSDSAFLNGQLHDFRIYRIPLTATQVGRIHYNGLHGEETVVNEHKEADDNLPEFSEAYPQLYNQYLTGVSDVKVETVVGYLPRLPRYVNGVFSNGIKNGKVRVLWPAPKDNSEVLNAGTYTITGHVPGTNLKPKAQVTVKATEAEKTPELKLASFNLEQVTLNSDGHGQATKFIENRDKFITILAETNPDAFLYMFRNAFGQEQPKGAEALGVWDSQETKLRGHATGHYLTAIAQAYAGTGYDKNLQKTFEDKMNYMVNTLYSLSQMSGQPKVAGGVSVSDPTAVPFGPGKSAYDSDLSEAGIRTDYWNWGKGFISAYPPDQFIMLEHGATYGGQETQIWAPYYTLHKILAGLMDVYEVSGNTKALEIAKGMGGWVHARLSQLPTSTLISMWNSYIAGEFGGMNEAMARLYRLTDEKQYLKTAQLFDNIKMFFGDASHAHGLAKNVDSFRGLHANQHIPQVMGALETYRDSQDADYFRIADNFWYKTTNDYMYSIGGVAGARNPANAECFIAQPATLYENGLSAGGQNETCATYNMLKLSRNLFFYEPRAELMDYYERGLYNHILASVAEDSPANTYHVPLRPASVKHFGNPDMKGFTCCNGTAIESSTKLQNSIYFKSKDNKTLYVNLYVPSTLEWSEKNVTIKQTTAFPNEDHTTLTVKGKGKFDIKVRVPQWATKGFFVKINGKTERVDAVPGTYLTLARKWKDGDTIELRMPFTFHLDPVMDQQNIASLFYGPVLLAAQETEPRKDWRTVTLNAKDLGESITGNPETLEFTLDGVTFKPFYNTYERHSVYLNVNFK
ncbi:beta-L-arabinofuranosidase domain-containing protein [Formosa sp. S-31]|uniref:beta-L-arabinofuranosidase domain-containing protein n=1 Tax=Formosa sp. S-31 TaxID=2790949 RepID=UPI003EBF33E0